MSLIVFCCLGAHVKLYFFETCPFGVRARMVLGLKQIPCELVYRSGDDADTLTIRE
jgi:glutaredoxin 2